MKRFKWILLIAAMVLSCQAPQRPRIEKFVWIRHNFFRIDRHYEHKVRYYLSYNDSLKTVFYGLNHFRTDSNIYSKSKRIDSLSYLICKNLYKKKLALCLVERGHDNGDFYTLIYQFEGESAHCIHYEPEAIPDSLKSFFNFLESVSIDTTQKDAKPFNIKAIFEIYKDSIFQCVPPPPPPPSTEIEARVKFVGPN